MSLIAKGSYSSQPPARQVVIPRTPVYRNGDINTIPYLLTNADLCKEQYGDDLLKPLDFDPGLVNSFASHANNAKPYGPLCAACDAAL